MTELLPCRWRGMVNAEGKYPCLLPGERLAVSPGGVSAETCGRCYYRDLDVEADPPAPRPTTMPSVTAQAVAFAAEMARWNAAGRPRTPPEQLAERAAACSACEYKVVEGGRDRCSKCGCYMQSTPWLWGTVEIPGKLELATSECPVGKWKSLL